MKKSSFHRIYVILVLLFFLSSCSQPQEPASLRIGVLPVLDTLPLYVAEAQGYFEEAGVNVELVAVNSAPERDQLMQTGQIDGMLNELVSTILYNRDGAQVKAIRFARVATSQYPLFRLLAAPGSGIETVNDVANVPIAISDGTVIEYTTDRLLEYAGILPEDVAKISVPKIPDRLALLMSGEVQVANLPDPVASLAIANGCTLVIDDTVLPEVSNSVYTFSVKALEDKPDAVKAFMEAVEKAVKDINADKTKWDNLLLERGLVPEAIIESYILPDYPEAGVPDDTQYQDALDWLLRKGLLEQSSDYNMHVDGSFFPE